MAVTSWKSCGTCANDSSSGSLTWHVYDTDGEAVDSLTGTEVSSDNGSTASTGNAAGFQHSNSATTQWLKCTNFGFSTSDIPDGSTIDGIEVEFLKARTGGIAFTSTDVKFVLGGTVSGNDISSQTDWSTSETADTFGGATEKGGLTIDDSDVRSSSFGAALQVVCGTSRVGGGAADAGFVDQVRIRVYYTEDPGIPPGGSYPALLAQMVVWSDAAIIRRYWGS